MPIKKEVANDDDDGYDNEDDKKRKAVEYRLSFIDSGRLMPGKLLDLVDNLSGIHNKKCKKC